MPKLEAAKKALRQNIRRRAINDSWRRLAYRAVHTLKGNIRNSESAEAAASLTKTQKNLDRAARRNIIHPNTAARRKSRLAKQVNQLTK